MRLAILSSKKIQPKPYAAKLEGETKVWAKKNKLTNTQISFTFDDGVETGDVIEWRAAVWDGENYTDPKVRWGLVTDDNFVLISRTTALKATLSKAVGNPWVKVTGSDYSGDLSGGLTEAEEEQCRREMGGDFLVVRKADGSLFLPVPENNDEFYEGTIQGFAWHLPTVHVDECPAKDILIDEEEEE